MFLDIHEANSKVPPLTPDQNHTRVTPKIPAAPPGKGTNPTYSPVLLPYSPGEYVGLVLLPGGAAGIFGVTLVLDKI